MHNHAHDGNDVADIVAAVKKESSSRLLSAFGQFVKYPDHQSFQAPITMNGQNLSVGQGLERIAIYKAVIEELGSRLDRI